jgi:hypothetical protein
MERALALKCRLERLEWERHRPVETTLGPEVGPSPARIIRPFHEWPDTYLRHYFSKPWSKLHRWLADRLPELHRHRGTRTALVAPRGAAKSTWVSLFLILYEALNGFEPYIMLISETRDQAKLLMEAVKNEIEDNPALRTDFPHVCGQGDVWQQDRIRLRNGVVIEALGTGSKIRGRRNRAERPTLIVVDDPEGEEHINSPTMRGRTWNWFTRAVGNVGTATTNQFVLGTALQRECLVLRLAETPGWEHRIFRAIETWPERMDLWAQWEEIYQDYYDPDHEAKALKFYRQNQAAMDAGAELLWPEVEPLLALMQLRIRIGKAAFASEKQGDPINPEACEWPAEYFDYPGFWFEQWPSDLEIKTLALDPSKGKDAKTGDYSAFVKYGRDRQGVEYIEANLARRPTDQIVAEGVAMVQQFEPDGFAIESNQFQELLRTDFLAEGKKQKVDLPIYLINNQVTSRYASVATRLICRSAACAFDGARRVRCCSSSR